MGDAPAEGRVEVLPLQPSVAMVVVIATNVRRLGFYLMLAFAVVGVALRRSGPQSPQPISAYAGMIGHAYDCYPEEMCGLLAGSATSGRARRSWV